MSIDVMNLVWRSTLEGSSKRFVLLALADRADDEGYCWPGMQSLIDKTGLSESTIKRVRRELEAERLLLQEERWTRQGDRDTNGYWVNLEALRRMQRPRVSERGPHPMETQEDTSGGWGRGGPTPGHDEPRGGVVVTPDTSVQTPASPHKTNQDQKSSASAASTQASTAQQPRIPSFDPPFDPESHCRREWVEEQMDGGFAPGEDAKIDSWLQRGWHPYHIVNALNAQRYGSVDKSPYRKGRTDVLERIGAKVEGGYRPGEWDLAYELLLGKYNDESIIEQIMLHRYLEARAA